MKHLLIITLITISLAANSQSYNWKATGKEVIKTPEQTQLIDKGMVCAQTPEDLIRAQDRLVLFAPANVCVTFGDTTPVQIGSHDVQYCATVEYTLPPLVPVNELEQTKTPQP